MFASRRWLRKCFFHQPVKTPKQSLVDAADNQRWDAVKEILEKHPNDNINYCHNYGWTVLHKTSFNGNVDVCKLLLQFNHVNVNPVTRNGDTPLDKEVIDNKHREVIDPARRKRSHCQ